MSTRDSSVSTANASTTQSAPTRLLKMVDQIADNVGALQASVVSSAQRQSATLDRDDVLAQQVVAHIRKFWSVQMRRRLIDFVEQYEASVQENSSNSSTRDDHHGAADQLAYNDVSDDVSDDVVDDRTRRIVTLLAARKD